MVDEVVKFLATYQDELSHDLRRFSTQRNAAGMMMGIVGGHSTSLPEAELVRLLHYDHYDH